MTRQIHKSLRIRTALIFALMTVLASGCSTKVTPLTQHDRNTQAAADVEAMFKDQEPILGAITIYEAMARAMKYNLDHKLKTMEYALEIGIYDLSKMDLLPQMAIKAGYSSRSNNYGATSISLLTGEESLEASSSQERKHTASDAQLYWNVLDFGIAYASSKQAGNQVLIAEERRRRTLQNIIQDVRWAYWRAVAAKELEQPLAVLIKDVRRALKKSDKLVEKKWQSKESELRYQKDLLETLKKLTHLRRDLALAFDELGALMGVKPGTAFAVVAPQMMKLGEISTPIDQLERQALEQHPQLREEDYRLRISQLEARKAMLRMYPGLEFSLGGFNDTNRLLYNQSWGLVGLNVSWNLLNVFKGPGEKRKAQAQIDLDNTRRQALTMSVMSQVHLSIGRYNVARDSFFVANKLANVNGGLLDVANAGKKASTKNELEIIHARSTAFVARLAENLSYAEVQNALGRIYNTIGKDPLPDTIAGQDLKSLTAALKNHWNEVYL